MDNYILSSDSKQETGVASTSQSDWALALVFSMSPIKDIRALLESYGEGVSDVGPYCHVVYRKGDETARAIFVVHRRVLNALLDAGHGDKGTTYDFRILEFNVNESCMPKSDCSYAWHIHVPQALDLNVGNNRQLVMKQLTERINYAAQIGLFPNTNAHVYCPTSGRDGQKAAYNNQIIVTFPKEFHDSEDAKLNCARAKMLFNSGRLVDSRGRTEDEMGPFFLTINWCLTSAIRSMMSRYSRDIRPVAAAAKGQNKTTTPAPVKAQSKEAPKSGLPVATSKPQRKAAPPACEIKVDDSDVRDAVKAAGAKKDKAKAKAKDAAEVTLPAALPITKSSEQVKVDTSKSD